MSRKLSLVLALSSIIGVVPAIAQDCTWEWVNPSPLEFGLSDIDFGAGRYIAVGDAGVVTSGDNPRTWVSLDSGTDASLNAVRFDAGRWIAVGDGVVVTSEDGDHWRVAWSGSEDLAAVARGTGGYVAVASSGSSVLTSEDGLTWKSHATGVAGGWRAIVWDGDRFVATGGTSVYASGDGEHWSLLSVVPGHGVYPYTVLARSPDRLWWANSGQVFASTDGVTWTLLLDQSSGSYPMHWNEIAAFEDVVVASGGHGPYGGSGHVFVSMDQGASWQEGTIGGYSAMGGSGFSAVVRRGNVFAAVASFSDVFVSDDGIAWECALDVCSPGLETIFTDVVTTPASTIAVSTVVRPVYGELGTVDPEGMIADNATAISTDGRTWNLYGYDSYYGPRAVAYGNGRLVGVRELQSFVSDDGTSWSSQIHGLDCRFRDVEFSSSTFVATGQRSAGTNTWIGCLATSHDGISWSAHDIVGFTELNAILWDGARFVVTGEEGTLTSPDGDTWTVAGSQGGLHRLAFSGSAYVATAGDHLWRSVDATQWTPVDVPGGLDLDDVEWTGELFVAVGDAVVTSPDGLSWATASGSPANFESLFDRVAWVGNGLVAVGEYGTIAFGVCDSTTAELEPTHLMLAVGESASLELVFANLSPVSGTAAVTNSPPGVVQVADQISIPVGAQRVAVPVVGTAPGEAVIEVLLPPSLGAGRVACDVSVTEQPAEAVPAVSRSGLLALVVLIAAAGLAVLRRSG